MNVQTLNLISERALGSARLSYGVSQMKTYLLSAFLLTANLYGFNAEEIKKIASEPHSCENLIEELTLYPEAREYRLTARSGTSANKLRAPDFDGSGYDTFL